MRIVGVWIIVGIFGSLNVYPQSADTIKSISLSEVVISESYQARNEKKSALSIDKVQKDFLEKHFTGNLVQTIENIPGIQSMDIGMGFSKPMIRGLGFNRIAVSENGIKQEGQQWGADHGLEIDAFDVEEIRILKGPASLLYGSDGMGGVIEIRPADMPAGNCFLGELSLLGKSVNGTLGASLKLALKKNRWMFKVRYSEQQFGDYHVPTDTVVYLTQRLPIYGKKLKNTAGFERDANCLVNYHFKNYQSNYAVSNAYQKVGFFAGAHGIPDLSRLQDDGDERNIELPFSKVNHFKASTHQQFSLDGIIYSADLGYQYNHREEWSSFHTHYTNQPAPLVDPNRELAFRLHTGSASLKVRLLRSTSWEHVLGGDLQLQKNTIAGYSFLLPAYTRITLGGYYLATWHLSDQWTFTGGIRYDWGKINISAYQDPYLSTYLHEQGYSNDLVASYRWRSYPVNKTFGDYSCSAGMIWTPTERHLLKFNIGRSFRLPGPNELASNGVHHGTFRHEQGDASLNSERGWQADLSYQYKYGILELSLSPFISSYDNYIYLKPTGEWSVLPHAGQIYRYSGTSALFAGGELGVSIKISDKLKYTLNGEYVYTYNREDRTALSYSPPVTLRNVLLWQEKNWQFYCESQSIASQSRVARNEEKTSGTNLFHLGGSFHFEIGRVELKANIALRNLLNTRYYNHLSFYRKIEVPEPGRNIQISINVPFKIKLK